MTAGAASAARAARPHSLGRTIRAYVALTKPRVLELLLVTTVPVMILAQGGFPNIWLVLATVHRRLAERRLGRARSTCTSTATSTRTCSAPRTARS